MVFIADFIMLGDLMAAVCPVGDRRIMQILPDKNFKLYLHTKGDDFQHSLGCVKPSCPAGKDRCERKTGRCWRAARRRPGQGGEQHGMVSWELECLWVLRWACSCLVAPRLQFFRNLMETHLDDLGKCGNTRR
jgi:hypothetical protein